MAVLHCPVESLTAEEWLTLKEISTALQPFDAVTVEISAETTVTVSKVIMLCHGLTAACFKIMNELTSDMAKDLMAKLLHGLRKRFDLLESNTILASAIFLDPRFKKRGFRVNSCYIQVVNDITVAVASHVTLSTATTETPQPHSTLAAQTSTDNGC